MSPTIASSFQNFLASVTNVALSLFHSILAIFLAILSLGIDIVHGTLSLGQSVISLVLDLFQGVWGFVTANLVALTVLGGGYYLYTLKQQNQRGGRTKGSLK